GKPALAAVPEGGAVRCIRWTELPAFRVATDSEAPAAAESRRDAAPTLLAIDDLRCHYPLRRTLADALRRLPERAVRAVDGVSLELARAATLAVVGESGCGKTTLGRAIVGLLAPTTGDVRFDGDALAGLARHRARDLRRRI